MFDEEMDINRTVELRCKTIDYFGVGAIKKIVDIAKDLHEKNIDRMFIVTGKKSYKFSGAWDYVRAAFEEKAIEYGLSLAVLLPAVLKATYPYAPKALAEVYSSIVPDLKGLPSEAEKVAVGIEAWLSQMGVPQKLSDLGFEESDVTQLVSLAFETPMLGFLIGLSPAPVEQHKEIARTIYEESFHPYS
jgi:alcohol dehydrogenase class IV